VKFKRVFSPLLLGLSVMSLLFSAPALAVSRSAPVRPALVRTAAPLHPVSAFLDVGYVAQAYNNCGPASIVSVLRYYGLQVDQGQVAQVLRPNGGYMLAGVIPPFVERYGLKATRFKNGKLEYLRQLTAAGIPVIVLQWLNNANTIPHFRVIRGYDDRSGLVFLSDPIYGPNVYVSYSDFERLWSLAGQEFVPIYRPAQTALVGRILNVRL
jgi:uncharacterized protein